MGVGAGSATAALGAKKPTRWIIPPKGASIADYKLGCARRAERAQRARGGARGTARPVGWAWGRAAPRRRWGRKNPRAGLCRQRGPVLRISGWAERAGLSARGKNAALGVGGVAGGKRTPARRRDVKCSGARRGWARPTAGEPMEANMTPTNSAIAAVASPGQSALSARVIEGALSLKLSRPRRGGRGRARPCSGRARRERARCQTGARRLSYARSAAREAKTQRWV